MMSVYSTAVRLKTHSHVWASLCVHGTCAGVRGIHRICRCQQRYKCYDGGQQLQRWECATGGAHNARLQPSDTKEPAGRRCAGWLCRAPSRWTFCTCLCPWNGEQGSDCRDAQNMQCKPASTFIKVWKAGVRLPHSGYWYRMTGIKVRESR